MNIVVPTRPLSEFRNLDRHIRHQHDLRMRAYRERERLKARGFNPWNAEYDHLCFVTTNNKKVGSSTSMTVTNLNSLASSATAGWQSVRVDDSGAGSTLALDYQISVKLTFANTAPANDKVAYVYLSPAYYDGSAWYQTDGGTATLPGGSEGTYTIANPNNLVLLGAMIYSTAIGPMQASWNISRVYGQYPPDGFQIIIVNFTGAAISASGNVVQYKPITETNT